jgi:hypothetical protein
VVWNQVSISHVFRLTNGSGSPVRTNVSLWVVTRFVVTLMAKTP